MALTREQFDAKLAAKGLPEKDAAYLRRQYYNDMVRPTLKGKPREQKHAAFAEWGILGSSPIPSQRTRDHLLGSAMENALPGAAAGAVGIVRGLVDAGPIGAVRHGTRAVAETVVDAGARAVGIPTPKRPADRGLLLPRDKDAHDLLTPGGIGHAVGSNLIGAVLPLNVFQGAKAAKAGVNLLPKAPPPTTLTQIAKGIAGAGATSGTIAGATSAGNQLADKGSISLGQLATDTAIGTGLGGALGGIVARQTARAAQQAAARGAAKAAAAADAPPVPARDPSVTPEQLRRFEAERAVARSQSEDYLLPSYEPPLPAPLTPTAGARHQGVPGQNPARGSEVALQMNAARQAARTATNNEALAQGATEPRGVSPHAPTGDPVADALLARFAEAPMPRIEPPPAPAPVAAVEPPRTVLPEPAPPARAPHEAQPIPDLLSPELQEEMARSSALLRRSLEASDAAPAAAPAPSAADQQALDFFASLDDELPALGIRGAQPAGAGVPTPDDQAAAFARLADELAELGIIPRADAPPASGAGNLARQLLSDESGSFNAAAIPGGTLRAAEATVTQGIRPVERSIENLANRALGKATEIAAAPINNLAGREVVRGGFDAATGEQRIGQQLAEGYDALREPIRRLFMGAQMGDDYKLLRRSADSAARAINREGEATAQALRESLTPPQLEELYRVLNDRTLTATDLASVSEPVRARINELSRMQHELGSLTDAQFTANEGQYLKRLYEKHLAAQPGVVKVMKAAANGLKGSKFRGKKDPLTQAQFDLYSQPWQKVADNEAAGTVTIHNPATGETRDVAAKKAGDFLSEWRNLGTKDGKVTAWRDWTPEERTAMGESKDAALALEATFKSAAREIRNGQLLRDVARNREMAIPVAEVQAGAAAVPDGWVPFSNEVVKGSTVRKWGKLADHYVRPDVAQDLIQAQRAREEMKTWRTLMSYWKKGKTVYNPGSHLNNFMQNTIALELNGGSLADLPTAARAIRNKGPLYQQLEDAGLFENTHVLTELANAITTAPSGSTTGLIAYTLRGLQKADAAVTDAYQGADVLFKIALVVGKMREGMPLDDAVNMARTRMYHGDINSPFIDKAANTVLPFIRPVAWTLAEVPKMMLRNPIKVAKLGLYWHMWNQAATMFSGQTAEQVEARRALLPDYLRGPFKVAQFPLRDTKGLPLMLGTAYWNPVGSTNPADGMERSALPFVPQFLDPGGPIRTAANLASNYDAFRERPIRDKSTSGGQQAYDVARYLVSELAPSNVFNQMGKVVDAARGVPDYGGRQYDVPTALANVIGIKLQPFDDKAAYTKMITNYARQIEDMKGVIGDAARDYARTGDQAAYQRVYDSQSALIAAKIQEMQARIEQARPALGEQPDTATR